jgi:hypothetical protein
MGAFKMKVDYELLQRVCDRAREIGLMKERIREASPERKAQHKRYAQSEAGRRSDLERHRRYRDTPHGREVARLKSLRFYARHKDDPAFKARKYGYEVVFRARQKARRLDGEHTLWLIGGCIKVNMGRVA